MRNRILVQVIAAAILAMAGAAYSQFAAGKPAATPFISFNNRNFLINGKPVWLFAGEIDYCRIPKELWRDRLMRMKRAGYNAASFYTFWNMHEPVRGQFHYEDNLDLDAWLTLVKELGLYAIVRPGPYICAETDFGGWPCWLVDIAGIKYRCNNTQYLQAVDAYWDNIFPIILKHQIHKGGAVIAVQLENEYWANPQDAAYKQHLIDKAMALNLEVPYIWSMMYNATEPNPGTFPNIGMPWFATEQWTGWIGRYGEPAAGDANTVIRATWKIVAAGTGGTTHYMALGGTNWGYTASDDQRTTSYDYGAPIGELGQFRSTYYAAKQAGLLATTFDPLLTTSTNGSAEVNSLPGGFVWYVHTGTAGKATFVLNPATAAVTFQVTWKNKGVTVPSAGNWSLEPTKFGHFLADVPITDNVTLDYSATGILCRKKFGTKNYIVLYGTTGNTGGDIAFVYKTAPGTAPASPWTWNAAARRAALRFTYPATDSVSEVVLDDGAGQTVNLLIMNNGMSNRTWATDAYIASGAEYVDESDNLHFTAAGGRAFIFSAAGKQTVTKGTTTGQAAKTLSTGWTWIASPEAGTSYNDASWSQSAAAQDMTYYNWANGYGWYRATYTAASADTATLAIPNKQDDIFIFVNGAWAGNSTSQSITLRQGANTIAILACDYCRSKAFGAYNVSPRNEDRSGIWGNITVGGTAVGPWRFRGGFEGVDESPMMGTISSASWTALLARTWSTGTPAADRVPRLWRMDFTYTPPADGLQTWTLNGTLTSATQGVVWLNGHCLGRNITNQPPLFVPQCWLKANNTLIVLSQEGGAPQGYSLQPVDWRSFAKVPTVAVKQGSDRLDQAAMQCTNKAAFVVAGDRFTVPKQFKGKSVNMQVYELSGQMISKGCVKAGTTVKINTNKVLSKGVFLVKLE